MAKFESIVRPVVLPNIRPPARVRSNVAEDDNEGAHVIRGSSGGFIDLPYSFSINISRQRQTEIKRRVDKVRVFQKEDDDTVNRDNFIDIEVVNKLWMKESGMGGTINSATGAGIPGGGSADIQIPANYARVEESDNIEIRKRNVVKNNPDNA